jgi:circadian clock protein KaiC
VNEAELSEEPVPRVSTGSAGLDTILHGGWMHGGTYMATGAPGTGKTIFGNQFCFAHVAAGGRAVYVTMLAESHGRMMVHLRTMDFFQREVIGQALHYVSGYSTLKTEGHEGLLRLFYRLVREHQATALVVDGVLAVQELSDSKLAFREFLHALGVQNALAGCTSLVLTNQQQDLADPQFAMVDGVVRLYQDMVDMKLVRSLEVMKLRGSSQLLGRHTFDITQQGFVVHPRLESLYHRAPQVLPDPERRLGFGVPRLDEMLGGGVPAHTSSLLFGSPGSGKTLLGLHFLAHGARQDEPGLYLGFMETSPRLLVKAAGVGLELQQWVDSGRLVLETRAAVEALPDALVHDLLDLVERHRVRRLVIDGVESLVKEAERFAPHRIASFLTALTNELRSRGVTTLMTQQTHVFFGPRWETTLEGMEAIVDNLLALRYVELRSHLYRMVSVLKMRESDYDSSLRELSISTRGIYVAESSESAEAILTGQPRKPREKKAPRKKPARRTPSRRRSRS